MSSEPSEGVMKPKPDLMLNHFTVPEREFSKPGRVEFWSKLKESIILLEGKGVRLKFRSDGVCGVRCCTSLAVNAILGYYLRPHTLVHITNPYKYDTIFESTASSAIGRRYKHYKRPFY